MTRATLGERARMYAEQAVEPLGLALGLEVPAEDMERLTGWLAGAFESGWCDGAAGRPRSESPTIMVERPTLATMEKMGASDWRSICGFVLLSYTVGYAAHRDDQRPARALVDRMTARSSPVGGGRKGRK